MGLKRCSLSLEIRWRETKKKSGDRRRAGIMRIEIFLVSHTKNPGRRRTTMLSASASAFGRVCQACFAQKCVSHHQNLKHRAFQNWISKEHTEDGKLEFWRRKNLLGGFHDSSRTSPTQNGFDRKRLFLRTLLDPFPWPLSWTTRAEFPNGTSRYTTWPSWVADRRVLIELESKRMWASRGDRYAVATLPSFRSTIIMSSIDVPPRLSPVRNRPSNWPGTTLFDEQNKIDRKRPVPPHQMWPKRNDLRPQVSFWLVPRRVRGRKSIVVEVFLTGRIFFWKPQNLFLKQKNADTRLGK